VFTTIFMMRLPELPLRWHRIVVGESVNSQGVVERDTVTIGLPVS
jgi:hypothetical protein